MTFWSQRVFLTGGNGFLGRAIRKRLAARGAHNVLAPRSSELDLRDAAAVRKSLEHHRPELVIHGAAIVGGIGANRDHPGRFFYENAVMGLHLIEECRRIVDGHGGRLWAENDPRGGAVFRFTLPAIR